MAPRRSGHKGGSEQEPHGICLFGHVRGSGPRLPIMRLLGKYSFDLMRETFQGVFGFSQAGSAFIIDLWQLRFSSIPQTIIKIEVRGAGDKYIQIGQITLSNTNK